MQELEAERERRWKSEKATKKLVDHINELQTKGEYSLLYYVMSPWCGSWTSISTVQERLLNLITHSPPLCVLCIVRKHKKYIYIFCHVSKP